MSSKTLLPSKLQPDVEGAAIVVRNFVTLLHNPNNQERRNKVLCSNLRVQLKQSGVNPEVIRVITKKSVLPKLVQIISTHPTGRQGVTKQKTLMPIRGCNTPSEWKELFVQKLLKSEL